MKLKSFLFILAFVIYTINCSDEDLTKQEKPKYVKPTPSGATNFVETFDANTIGSKWIKSKAKKDEVEETIAKYDGQWSIESSNDAVLEGDQGLVLKSKAKHHAIASKLSKTFDFTQEKPLIVQYEVKFQNALECGGAYVKLIADDANFKLEEFFDKTSFSIMFGPDKCGTETKYHFIIRFKNPVTGKFEEKHAKKSELLDSIFSDGKTHLFTLILRPDNTYKMMIDRVDVNSGSILNDLTPAINPPREIVDPNDKKPESWDDREKIPDPDAVKPDDWDESEPKMIDDPNAQMPEGWLEDEPETLPDPNAVKPEDWDDATDGDWEAPKIDNPKCKEAAGCGPWKVPQIANPKYKGKWRAPLIENTNYQGKWEPRKIENPEFFEDSNPFRSLEPFSSLGLELWSMTENIYFDNFLITNDELVAEKFADDTWVVKKNLEQAASSSSDSVIDSLLKAANEKPWLWAIYVVVVLLPIVIVVVFCCSKSSSKSSADDAKKTDAPTEDDNQKEEQSENTEAPEETEGTDADGQEDKGDLEKPTESNQADNEPSDQAKKSPARRRTRKE